MYILYLDASGTPDVPTEQYFILAGIAAFERQITTSTKKSIAWSDEAD